MRLKRVSRMTLKRALIALTVIVAGLWLNNTSLFVPIPPEQTPRLLAHRGVHQIYAGEGRGNDTCTAQSIAAPQHDFIANTIRSMQAAFDFGADIVELDVHLTSDNTFAVFHDWTLDCQTNGAGVTHKQSFEYLSTLDLGYRYSADGQTFPLRGTAIGEMPTLQGVLDANLGGQYLINFKSNRASEGRYLASMLGTIGSTTQMFGVYGGAAPTRAVTALRGFDRPALKKCLLHYALMGWTGYVPDACHATLVAVPMDYGHFLWGWPYKFTKRMKHVGTDVILWGPYDGSGFSSGIDDATTLSRVPAHFDGILWTNRIEVIGPLLKPAN
ncbi:MAG: glycerophosphodiester phosphodiesterase family protein [Tateyamaria sp.]|uniref:glycerophosphodiester phosphodiesterase family protein n=1 Tax=Tateyamaria sp. TaxID=1929288 RepID=UPI00327B5D42